ncbi:MAG: hypothetical protein Q9198_004932 [Flavoplaca austrocitrina]
MDVSFQQPEPVRNLSAKDRKEWWDKAKRLQSDAVVCFIGPKEILLFCTVCEFRERPENAKGDDSETPENHNLYSDAHRAFAILKVCEPDKTSIRNLLFSRHSWGRATLVEFPGVLLPAFQPTLQALQRMSRTLEVAFSNLLVPGNHTNVEPDYIPPPRYADKPHFRFRLNQILNQDVDLRLSVHSAFDPKKLHQNSALDEAQSRAVVESLTRSFSLTQGPPGTGKSYTGVSIIRVLLDNRVAARIGPILCVCYTNHALDQLLEHLVSNGVSQIIRVGSRSKSEVVSQFILSQVARSAPLTKTEKRALWEYNSLIEVNEKEIRTLLKQFENPDSWQSIQTFLESEHPRHYRELFSRFDEDGFERVQSQPGKAIMTWLSKGGAQDSGVNPRSITVLQQHPSSALTQQERRSLYDSWVTESRRWLRRLLVREILAYNEHRAHRDRIRQEVKLRCLQDAHIIGVTTSGLARNLELIEHIKSKVMVCEEAGEVLEAHLLTALLPSVEHAILIGDHLQLRPQVQRYELRSEHPRGRQYSLDVSLFERLVLPRTDGTVPVPFSTLETQRRMHPSISGLIRKTLYPALQDDESVKTYPSVTGMTRRLFWLDHTKPETGADKDDTASTSHSNEHEIRLTTALASHLLRQGVYEPNEIAILTPYLGQLHLLRRDLGRMYEVVLTDRDMDDLEKAGLDANQELQVEASSPRQTSKSSALKALKVATIDNFQGEEAKVVIISLVRSNAQNKCGFLKTSNRINVLLSRAQHGMYIIGNARTARSVQMWVDVTDMLQQDNGLGPDLELQCPRHPEIPIKNENYHAGIFNPISLAGNLKTSPNTNAVSRCCGQFRVVDISSYCLATETTLRITSCVRQSVAPTYPAATAAFVLVEPAKLVQMVP